MLFVAYVDVFTRKVLLVRATERKRERERDSKRRKENKKK